MVEARGNTVTHGFILVPATGPYVQHGCASALHYSAPGVLVVGVQVRQEREGSSQVKRTGLSNGQPDSLYRRDSPWISSYYIQNSFQLHITVILLVKVIRRIYLLQNPKDCDTSFRVQSPWAKKKQLESGKW